jgi:hypothetical protein
MSKFNVGDWVKSIKYRHLRPIKIQTIYESNTRHGTLGLKSNGTVLYSDEVELWEPKEGEWCWFYDRICKVTNYDERPYIEYQDDSHYVDDDELEPFIGELPSFLKEKQ